MNVQCSLGVTYLFIYDTLPIQPLNGSTTNVMALTIVTPRPSVCIEADIRAGTYRAVITCFGCDNTTIAAKPASRGVWIVTEGRFAIFLCAAMTQRTCTGIGHGLKEEEVS